MATTSSEQQEEVLAGRLDALTPRTIVDPGRLRDRLDEVRRTGVAQSDGERQAGAGSVAAPVFGVDGSVQGAISVCGPADRVGPAVRERYVPLLVEAADRISRGMGWRGGLPVQVGSR